MPTFAGPHLIGILLLIALSFPPGSRLQAQSFSQKAGHRPSAVEGRVIVKFDPMPGKSAERRGAGVPFNQLVQQVQVIRMDRLFPYSPGASKASRLSEETLRSLSNLYEVRYASVLPPHVVAAMFMQSAEVEYAEPRYIYALGGEGLPDRAPVPKASEAPPNGVRAAPNDPQYVQMRHLQYLKMPEAWDIVKASEGDVVVGIVDGGVEWTHSDLFDNLWRNPRELDNGIDDDGNGLRDDIHGWNFADESNDPSGLDRTPFNGQHGTQVAGVVAAVTDNRTGISGASWNASFMPVNAGCPFTDNAICFGYDGMIYAALAGADIINVSWGGPDSFFGREAVRIVQEEGALLVVSAGNKGGTDGVGVNIDAVPEYPASYDGVLVVGAVLNDSDQKAGFSNYGVSVDVFAPGIDINSTFPGDTYTADATGTSFSAPIVVGLAALVRTHFPNWTAEQVREQIRVTSANIDLANDASLQGLLGRGRIDVVKALTDRTLPSLRVTEVSFTESGGDGAIQEGDRVDVTLHLRNVLQEASQITMTAASPDSLVTLLDATQSFDAIAPGQEVAARFAFQLADRVPVDHLLPFRVTFEGNGYQDADRVEFTANRVTHDNGVIQVSLTDEGNIGRSGLGAASTGQGFRYFGVDWLFEGGLVMALGMDRIVNSVRNTMPLQQDEDFEREEATKFGIFGGQITDENGRVVLREKRADGGGGLRVQQESYLDSGNENSNFLIVRYIISLPEAAAGVEDSVYVGLFCDWDLTTQGGGDFARYDEERRLGIVQPSADNPTLLLGTKLLTTGADVSYRSIQNKEIFDSRSGGDGFTDEEKWAFLSGGVQRTEVDNDDVSTLIASGPHRLAPGDRLEVAFALLAATRLESMRRYADNAQKLWANSIRSLAPKPVPVDEPVSARSFVLEPVFPNPVRQQAFFRFVLPRPGTTRLVVYDMLGREVKTLVDAALPAGEHRVAWDGRNRFGNEVADGAYLYRLDAASRATSYSSSRMLIVVSRQ